VNNNNILKKKIQLSKLIKLKQKPPTQPRLKLLTREKAENPNFLITKKKSKKLEIF